MIDQKLITFLTLTETMNYHDTAKRLNMTQPAVTQHIKALEAEYNCLLFIYDRRTLKKTPEAEILRKYASSALYNEKSLTEKLKRTKKRRLRIGATKSIGGYIMGDMLAKYLSNSSNSADITVDNTEKLLKMLDSNMLDFAMIEGTFDKSCYGSRILRTEKLTGICSPEHRFAGKTVPLADMLSETVILREAGSGTRDIFSALLSERGYTENDFKRSVTVNAFSLLCQLVSSGTGVSFVYESVGKSEKNISCFSIEGVSPSHELNFVYLRDTDAPEIISEFISDSTF